MTAPGFIEQLLAQPDRSALHQFLTQHTSALDDDVARCLKEQADLLMRADIHRCLEICESLLYMAELTGDPRHRALGLLAEGNARAIGLGEYQRSLEVLEIAAGIYRTYQSPVDVGRVQLSMIWPLACLGRYDVALQVGHEASAMLETHSQWLPLAKLTSNLAAIHGRLGQDAQALAMLDRARQLYGRLGAEGDAPLARVEGNRAILLRNLGQFDAAIQASQAAYDLLGPLGQPVEAARAQQNLAVTYFVLGRYNEALEILDRVRDIFLADGRQRDAILVELFISDCLLQLRRFGDVLQKCHAVRTLFNGLGTRFEVAQAILNEAISHAGLQNYPAAISSLAEARHLFQAEGNQVWVAATDLETAAILYRQQQFAQSLTVAQACAAIFQEHGLPVKAAQAHLVAARSAAGLQQADQAEKLVHAALAEAERRDIPSLIYPCRHLLGNLAEARGDLPAAAAAYDAAIQEVERLRGRLMVEFRADFLEDKQEVYEDMVRLTLELGQPARSLTYAERAKSRSLLDLLAYRLDLSLRPRSTADARLIDELMGLRAERDRLYRRWEGPERYHEDNWSAGESQQQARQDVLAVEKQMTDAWHRLLIHNAGYAREASLWQVRTEPIQPYLAPGTLLLEYFIARGELMAFLVNREAVTVKRLPGSLAQVQNLSRFLWHNMQSVPGSGPDRAAVLATNARHLLQQLYGLLIAPCAAELASGNYTALTIVPHGPLHYLPFHAFYDGVAYLLQRYEISYLPGASLVRFLQHPADIASNTISAEDAHPLAPPALGHMAFGHSRGGRLPHAVEEARTIAAILSGSVLLEEDASVGRFREIAPNCRSLHLATHADFRPDNPLFSGLALADASLTTLEVFNLHLQASLVTLSACQTGRNVVGGGDELLGLMRAFLYAGARSLVLSQWTVEDRSTARLMESFYRRLMAGATKGAALRYAQRQFIEPADTGKDAAAAAYVHPYFWAPFFLVGDTGPL